MRCALRRATPWTSTFRPPAPFAAIAARHLARDGAETLVVTYVRPTGDAARDARTLAAIRTADSGSVVTGYAALERALRGSLARDLPRVGLVALGSWRSRCAQSFAAFARCCSRWERSPWGFARLGWRSIHALHVRWHVYDAIAVPVLVGITIDESMFLLFAAQGRPPSRRRAVSLRCLRVGTMG
jgi:hypothetical protein